LAESDNKNMMTFVKKRLSWIWSRKEQFCWKI